MRTATCLIRKQIFFTIKLLNQLKNGFPIIVMSLLTLLALSLSSCNKDNKANVEETDALNAYFTPEVLRSQSMKDLPSYTSKEKIAALVRKLAQDKFHTDKVQVSDLYLYPDLKGFEVFYKLPNGQESNAILVNRKALGSFKMAADQLKISCDEEKIGADQLEISCDEIKIRADQLEYLYNEGKDSKIIRLSPDSVLLDDATSL